MDDVIASVTSDVLKEIKRLDDILIRPGVVVEKWGEYFWFSYTDQDKEQTHIISFKQFELYLRYSESSVSRANLMAHILGSHAKA